MSRGFVVAIDGPSASGKGTIASIIAQKLGFQYLDTGKLYRELALLLSEASINSQDTVAIIQALSSLYIEDIRRANIATILESTDVGEYASTIATIPEVRNFLYNYQRNFAENVVGVVIDGRDIGTNIFQDAECKIFITADIKIRAKRRYKQLQSKKKYDKFEDVLQDLIRRDQRDMNRAIAPLKVADNATVIDTSRMSINEAVESVISIVRSKLYLY